MKADLHVHSRFSDGSYWPADIVHRAVQCGLEYVALTDHDTLGGVDEFSKACISAGIRTTPAVEIDCTDDAIAYRSELLAYFPEGNFEQTQSMLAEIKEKRETYLRSLIVPACRHFVCSDLSFEELIAHKKDGRASIPNEKFSFNKVDLYVYLKGKALIPENIDYRTFKKAYLDSKLLKGSAYTKPTCKQVIETVHRDGGYVVLPHIGHEFDDEYTTIKEQEEKLFQLLQYFKSSGVDGVELYYYRNENTQKINQLVQEFASSLSLFFTYGSDCHGSGSGKEHLGLFFGDFTGFPA